jgi:hypothetical protein
VTWNVVTTSPWDDNWRNTGPYWDSSAWNRTWKIGTGTTALGIAGTPTTTGGNQETRKIKISRNTWQSSTAKEKGNDLRLSLWQAVHHRSTQVHQ